MNIREMNKLLNEGMHPVDVSIKKWRDGLKDGDYENLEKAFNCALCHVYHMECEFCPLYLVDPVLCCLEVGSPYDNFLDVHSDYIHNMAEAVDVCGAIVDMIDALKMAKQYVIDKGLYVGGVHEDK